MTAEYLESKGWKSQANAYGFIRWIAPDNSIGLPIERAISVQNLADEFNINLFRPAA